ncbi:JmjC domain-containing histone demethylation protein 1 [Thoreauomyces humboldtii]|nr:JmjC domain-containing histone demethylation protein 1 [Thoreauomyces humboldtii]
MARADGLFIVKEPTRKSKRKSTAVNYNELNEGLATEEYRFTKILEARTFAKESFQRLEGKDLTVEWARRNGLREPVIVDSPEGLDIKMPDRTLVVDQVADLCGRDRQVDAIEVSTQSERMVTLDDWAKYFHQPPEKRKRILNVISLEISETQLATRVRRPRIVRQLDWIDNVWPKERKLIDEYPRVQLYCLMSVKDSYTDFHIDFAGSSVWYHLLSGRKTFYFIPPTRPNLKKYEKWSSSPEQSNTFLGDEIRGGAIEVNLKAGNTMIIPTGWIHAVFTPEDSIVIGGNFLQGLNIPGQLAIYDIEERTNVPLKFRFPYFLSMQWEAARRYLKVCKHTPEVLSTWEIEGLEVLAAFLEGIAARMTDTVNVTKEDRKALRKHVPKDIKNVQKLLTKFKQYVATAKALPRLTSSKELQSPIVAATGNTAPLSMIKNDSVVDDPIGPLLLDATEAISENEDHESDAWLSERDEMEFPDSDLSSGDDDDYDSEENGNLTDMESSSDDEDGKAFLPGSASGTSRQLKPGKRKVVSLDATDGTKLSRPPKKRKTSSGVSTREELGLIDRSPALGAATPSLVGVLKPKADLPGEQLVHTRPAAASGGFSAPARHPHPQPPVTNPPHHPSPTEQQRPAGASEFYINIPLKTEPTTQASSLEAPSPLPCLVPTADSPTPLVDGQEGTDLSFITAPAGPEKKEERRKKPPATVKQRLSKTMSKLNTKKW